MNAETTPTDRLRQAAEVLCKASADVAHDVRRNEYWTDLGDTTVAKYAAGVAAGLGGPAGALAALMHPGVCESLALVLEQAADGYRPGVLGNGLAICPDCCETVPCSHIKPALHLADQILAAVPR